MKNILKTGGAGFISANLIRLLIREDFNVKVLVNFSTNRNEYLEGSSLKIIERDIRKNYSKVTKASRILGWRPEVSLDEGI